MKSWEEVDFYEIVADLFCQHYACDHSKHLDTVIVEYNRETETYKVKRYWV